MIYRRGRGGSPRADARPRAGAPRVSAAVAEWLTPSSLDAALALRAERGDATVLAGGTFLGILANQGFIDPPALLSLGGVRELRADDLILGYYETCIGSDELLVEVRVPAAPERAVYRKFRSRSSEDRPCVAVAAALRDGALRVVVGAVA